MKSKRFGERIFVRLERGEDIISSLETIVSEYDVRLGLVSGIGACSMAVIGNFDVSKKVYNKKDLSGSFEIISLSGNICTQDNKPYLHMHITLADENMNCIGGHLNKAIISATAEIVVSVYNGKLDRFKDEETGLNFWKL